MNTKHPPAGPDEAEVRKHFGVQLPPDAQLMRPAYTSVWALEDGTLLWDWRNGYADLSPKRATVEELSAGYGGPTNIAEGFKLKTVMYLTGPPASGKTVLADSMRNAIEINLHSVIGFAGLSRAMSLADKHDFYETIVITSNATAPTAFDVDNALRIWCRERKLKYYHINLTRK